MPMFRRRYVLKKKCLLSLAWITSKMLNRKVSLLTLTLWSKYDLIGFGGPENKVFPEPWFLSLLPILTRYHREEEDRSMRFAT